MPEKKYLLGNHAVAYGLVEGEIDAAFAYPGTPSSEIMEKLIELSKKENFYVEWSINEKVAYENAYGCAISGRKAAVIMKHVGLNVASDSFITSAYTGIAGGLTVVVADDPFAHSSQNEQDTRRYIKFAKVPGFEPSSIHEAKDMVSLSLRFSEKTELPVVVRLVTRISHGKSDVEIKKVKRKKKNVKFEKNPGKFVMVPANARKRLKILNEKQKFIKDEIEKLPFNWIDEGEGKFGIVASGISYQYVREFLKENNLKIPVLKIGTYPLPEKKIKKFLKKVNELIIFEEGDPVVEEEILIFLKEINPSCKVNGKRNGVVPEEGELSFEEIEKAYLKVKGKRKKEKKIYSFPVRKPVLCPGCPHLGTYYIFRKVFGKEAIYPGDIGCYTLGITLGNIDTCLCMGAGIGTGAGISKFEEKRKIISIIGDSTFFHAGIPELINSVYNQADHFIAILDNRTTAMTGHQPHPGTGITAKGEKTIDINLEEFVKSCGVKNAITIDPYKIKKSIEEVKKIKDKKGVKVIISKRECVLLKKGEKEKFYVDTEKCKGCKLCLDLGCPAITFENGKAKILVYCNGCGMCAEICPFNAIKKNEKV